MENVKNSWKVGILNALINLFGEEIMKVVNVDEIEKEIDKLVRERKLIIKDNVVVGKRVTKRFEHGIIQVELPRELIGKRVRVIIQVKD